MQSTKISGPKRPREIELLAAAIAPKTQDIFICTIGERNSHSQVVHRIYIGKDSFKWTIRTIRAFLTEQGFI